MRKFYPLGDRLTREDRQAINLKDASGPLPSFGGDVKGIDLNGGEQVTVKGVITGDKRPPRKGEWYLSGALPHAYRAPNDLSTAYHIVRLVKTKQVTTTVVVG